MLHAVYAVENFLHGLVRRKCNFHVVFFDNHEDLCVRCDGPTSSRLKYLVTRDILVRHLQLNRGQQNSDLQIRVFSSIQSEDFINYLSTTGVYFLMCHDGASTSALSTKKSGSDQIFNHHNLEGGDSNTETESGTCFRDQLHNKIGFRYMIYEFIRQGYNVALLNGLEWRDSKVRLWLYASIVDESTVFIASYHILSYSYTVISLSMNLQIRTRRLYHRSCRVFP